MHKVGHISNICNGMQNIQFPSSGPMQLRWSQDYVEEATTKITYARQPRYSRWIIYVHATHHQYLDTLTNR